MNHHIQVGELGQIRHKIRFVCFYQIANDMPGIRTHIILPLGNSLPDIGAAPVQISGVRKDVFLNLLKSVLGTLSMLDTVSEKLISRSTDECKFGGNRK